jgi:flagellar motor protein MotB
MAFERFANNTEEDITDVSANSYQEGWIISYIDILTLLLTLFVILLAMSHFKPDNSSLDQFTINLTEPVNQSPKSRPTSSESIQATSLDFLQKEKKPGKRKEVKDQIQEHKAGSAIYPDEVQAPAVSEEPSEVLQAETKSESMLIITESGNELSDVEIVTKKPYPDTLEKHFYLGAEDLFSNPLNAARILPVQTTSPGADNEIVKSEQMEESVFATDSALAEYQEQDMMLLPREHSRSLMRQIENSQLVHQIEISESQDRVNLVISDHILFAQGSADLKPEGIELLSQLAGMINETELNISVEGHTDDVPINNAHFPSNWELSTARATTVTRYLIGDDIAPYRIRAIGYADTRPRANNETSEGRERNRRVSIILHMPAELAALSQ